MLFARSLQLDLPKNQSAFLWGARKTGKSTYLKTHFPKSIRYDLLKTDLYLSFLKQPSLLREKVLALPQEKLKFPVIIDEIQKVPLLMDEVHWLIENAKIQFILCGSSARKLKRVGANLLGGRAWRYNFYPLTHKEIPSFDLLRACNNGLIPSHYLSTNANKSLMSYVEDYLSEEIQAEGLVRNLPGFARFLDTIGFCNGELTNYNNIARDCGIDAKTVKEYYQILVDTLLGNYILPYQKNAKRQNIKAMPKFYLFDVGVANFLAQRQLQSLTGPEAGKAFEHFILMEILAYKGLNDKRFPIEFWRTKTGLEVDFILNGEVAIEVKISKEAKKQNLKGLIAFIEEHNPRHAIVVSQDSAPRKIQLNERQSILVLPWQEFLTRLWQEDFI